MHVALEVPAGDGFRFRRESLLEGVKGECGSGLEEDGLRGGGGGGGESEDEDGDGSG